MRANTYEKRFNTKYNITDKSIKNLSSYFNINPRMLNKIYEKGLIEWSKKIKRNKHSYALNRVYKYILDNS